MDIDEAVTLTQDRLAQEGETMGDLLGHFRSRISPILVGDREWDRILDCAGKLPITIGRPSLRLRAAAACTRARGGLRRLGGQRNPIGRILSRARADRQDG